MLPLLLALLASPASPTPPPSDDQCPPLPAPKTPHGFGPGEVLEYDLDALGAVAGTMTMKVLGQSDGTLPVEVTIKSNTFFSKVRRVTGTGTSLLNPRTLRPVRYKEDATENEIHRTADVSFRAKDHNVHLAYTAGTSSGQHDFRYAHEGLDVAGTTYLLRQLPLREGLSVCFDAYGIRRLWRVSGRVEGKEHVSLPLGEFEAWHLRGEAIRLDDHRWRREIHVWISDDERRLPLAALGTIDLGAVRATLKSVSRPGQAARRAQGKETLKW